MAENLCVKMGGGGKMPQIEVTQVVYCGTDRGYDSGTENTILTFTAWKSGTFSLTTSGGTMSYVSIRIYANNSRIANTAYKSSSQTVTCNLVKGQSINIKIYNKDLSNGTYTGRYTY